MAARSVLPLAAGLLFAGCTTMLPHSDSTIHTPWTSFEEAKTAIERLEPHHTTRADLRAAGFDPFVNSNVELLNYSDILRRFPLPGPIVKLDPGLRECLEAGKSCTGYSIDLNQSHKERTGPFLLDLLSFKRETKATGWTFNALVLLVNDDVVYALYGGKPSITETETNVEPLGPLQNWNGSGLIR